MISISMGYSFDDGRIKLNLSADKIMIGFEFMKDEIIKPDMTASMDRNKILAMRDFLNEVLENGD